MRSKKREYNEPLSYLLYPVHASYAHPHIPKKSDCQTASRPCKRGLKVGINQIMAHKGGVSAMVVLNKAEQLRA